ncbi:MAG: hypothetical protein AAGB34_02150 [Planctomycetota bacterium]
MGSSMAKFVSGGFGPFELRGLLRSTMMPGERLVGWAAVERSGSPHNTAMLAIVGMIPVAGSLAAIAMQAPRLRVMVLTDTRLLVVVRGKQGKDPSGGGVLINEPLHGIDAEMMSEDRCAIVLHRSGRVRTYRVLGTDTSTAHRLIAGLQTLEGALVREETRQALRGVSGTATPLEG